jgi:hypothetical protein
VCWRTSRKVGALRGLVVVALALVALGRRIAGDSVDGAETWDRGLDSDRLIALVEIGAHVIEQLRQVASGGVAVRHESGTGCAAEQLVQRHVRGLGLDVPERDIYRRDRRHGDRPATPVRAAVEKLPGVFNLVGIPPDQQRNDVITQVADDGEFSPVERGIAKTRETVIGRELEGHEVAVRARDDDLGGFNLHWLLSLYRSHAAIVSNSAVPAGNPAS